MAIESSCVFADKKLFFDALHKIYQEPAYFKKKVVYDGQMCDVLDFVRRGIFSELQRNATNKVSFKLFSRVVFDDGSGYHRLFSKDERIPKDFRIFDGHSCPSERWNTIVLPGLTLLCARNGCEVKTGIRSPWTYICSLKVTWNREFVPNCPLPMPLAVAQVDLRDVLYNKMLNKENCDFRIESKEGAFIPVHSLILLSVSPYFETLAKGSWKEMADRKIKSEFSAPVIKAALSFIYTGVNPLLKEGIDPVETMKLAHLWEIKALFEYAVNEIGTRVEQYQYKEVADLAEMYDSAHLREVARCFRARRNGALNAASS